MTEDYGAVLLHLNGGARGVFHVMQMHAGRKNRLYMEVCGTEGSMVWDSRAPSCSGWAGGADPTRLSNRDPSLLSPEVAETSHYPGGHAEGFPDAFKQLDLAFYSFIGSGCTGQPRFPTFADGDREVRICEAIAQTGRERKWVAVSS